MRAHRHDPLAATRRAHTRERMAYRRETMAPEAVEAAMRKLIRQRLELDQPISQDDFRLANLPMDHVNASFKRVLKRVQNSMAMDRQ